MKNPSSARERILEAAFLVLCERGYGATNTREIAARAQVSKRELYAEFTNKQGIYAAMIADRAARMQQPFAEASVASRAAFVETLRRVGAAFLDVLSEPAVVAMFRLAISAAEESPQIARTLEDHARAPTRKAMLELMTRAHAAKLVTGDPGELVERFIALLAGGFHVSLLLGIAARPSARELDRRAGAAVDALIQLHGRRKAKSGA